MNQHTHAQTSRRGFLKASAAAGLALGAVPFVHAAGDDVLRVGLIGCGGRGCGAAENAVAAGANIKLTALADVFKDKVESRRDSLRKKLGDKFDVKDEDCFSGFDAYKQILAAKVDVVLLCTPPHFRPLHLEAALEAGKHVFCEKPVAVDAPGVRRVLAACEKAKEKKLAVVSGLCWRYDPPMRETIQRVHDGNIGDIVAMQCVYNTGYLWSYDRKPNWSDMEYQLRNWLYYTWLSGDHNVEQHIHSLDKMAWAMKNEYPVLAWGLGGRQVRTEEKFGNVFDHHSVVYEYKNGVKVFSFCRQQQGCANETADFVMGTKGTCETMAFRVTGPNAWKYEAKGPKVSMYDNEHKELFASIRAGKPINDGDWMAKSTLMAIMGRMATYTGQVIAWDDALKSDEDLTPAKYEFGDLAVAPVAMPGKGKKKKG